MLLTLAAVGAAELGYSLVSLMSPWVYRKDFIQEYLLARAVLNGVNPYLPLPQLAEKLVGPLELGIFPHPTPHPPAVAILSLPLGLLHYESAAVIWLIFEVVCIFAAAYLLLRWWGSGSLCGALLATLIACMWGPVVDELIIGQLNTLLLLLLILGWQALRKERHEVAGMMLGTVVALKLIAWPIIIFLTLRRQWRVVLSSAVVFSTANLLAALLMGTDRVFYYYLRVGAKVAPLYRAHEANFSLWSVGWRFFEGIHSEVVSSVAAPPVIVAPLAAGIVSAVLPVMLLATGLRWAAKAHRVDTAWGILVCVSVLISPVAWSHYLILTALPIVLCVRYLCEYTYPRWLRLFALMVAVLLFFPRGWMREMMLWFTVERKTNAYQEIIMTVPFTVGLLSLLPAVAVLGLMWLIRHLDRQQNPAAKQASPEELLPSVAIS